MKQKFQAGDRVKVIDLSNIGKSTIKKGYTGTVLGTYRRLLLIEFDDCINGHDGFGHIEGGQRGKVSYCWYVNPNKIELITPRVPTTKEDDYYINSEGFKTSKKNWNGGLNLV